MAFWETLKPPTRPSQRLKLSHDHPTQRPEVRSVRRSLTQTQDRRRGELLQVIAQHINFTALATLVGAFIEHGEGRRGVRGPPIPPR